MLVAAMVTAGGLGSIPVVAAPVKDQAAAKAAAKTVLARGARDLDARLYGRALAEFHEAYRIFPSPKIFFDIGLANMYLGHLGEALQAFETFLAEAPDAPEERNPGWRVEHAPGDDRNKRQTHQAADPGADRKHQNGNQEGVPRDHLTWLLLRSDGALGSGTAPWRH